MTDLDEALAANPAAIETAVSVVPSKVRRVGPPDPARSRRSKNNRARGNAAELDVARSVNGRKVGPLGHPWDVEMAGYARLQVRKYQTPQGLRAIATELARIARAPGEEMPGYVWIEPGRGGERLIVFRLKDFSERHGLPSERTLEETHD